MSNYVIDYLILMDGEVKGTGYTHVSAKKITPRALEDYRLKTADNIATKNNLQSGKIVIAIISIVKCDNE